MALILASIRSNMKRILLSIFLISAFAEVSRAQQLESDFNTIMRIPDIVNMESSATHKYVLSESEGLVVFRTNTDTLQWVLTSEGMTSRGHTMRSDVRFAYLYGNGKRLTVLEPTSLLGVYSSTFLPEEPTAVARVGTNLYIGMGAAGLGRLSLLTPALFDNTPENIHIKQDNSINVTDLVRLPLQLIALSGQDEIIFFDVDGDDISFSDRVTLRNPVSRLHVLNDGLYASDQNGVLYQVRSTGQTLGIADMTRPISHIKSWNNYFIVRTNNGLLYSISQTGDISDLRTDRQAGNFFTISQNNLWVSNYAEVARNTFRSSPESNNRATTSSALLRISPVDNIVSPFPRPVIFTLNVAGASPEDIRIQYRSEVDNAEIRGQSFYWQPQNNHIGINRFTITATNAAGMSDSTAFTVDVRSFNAPPRFNPVRPMSIVVGENFQLPLRAVDPDGLDRDLIRYHGVDLPDGATISERTGMFTWSPDRRQVGTHQFQVIATDQFGAASSLPVSITVRNINQDPSYEND